MSAFPKGSRRSSALTIRGLARAYSEGTASPVEVTQSALKRIEKLNPVLNCFITILGESARKASQESERRHKQGSPIGPLDGVPVAIKDLIYIKGVRCTAGSRILRDNIAGYDSPVTRRLKEAGAILLGTTNLHEFAAGVTSENPHFGPVRNPWDPSRMAGGSSGGSAAAVASGIVPGAIGTDTGGSVRIPASLCGTLGLKPTYGRVSRLGVVPLAASLDAVGTLNVSAWDAAAMLQVIAGHEEGDLTTVDVPVPDYASEATVTNQAPKIGVPRRYFHDLVDPEIEARFSEFLRRLQDFGCTLKETELDGIDEAYANWFPIRRAEATAFHRTWLEKTPELYGADVRRLLELGNEVKAVDYVSAVNSRTSLMSRFESSMGEVEVVAVPTVAVPAPPIGKSSVSIGAREIDVYTALNRLTLPFNLVGFPALSFPAGLANGLPAGVQLVAKPFEEERLLRLAASYEERFGSPPLAPDL